MTSRVPDATVEKDADVIRRKAAGVVQGILEKWVRADLRVLGGERDPQGPKERRATSDIKDHLARKETRGLWECLGSGELMEYLVTPVWTGEEDPLDWTAVTGREEKPETPVTGSERPDPLDSLGLLGRRVRKETLDTSRTTVPRVHQVIQDQTVNLESEVLRVRPVTPVQWGPRDTLAHLVLPVSQGQWGAAVTDMKERKETRATWVFPDPAVLRATAR